MTSPKDQTRDRGESATAKRHWMALQGENASRRRCGMMEEGGRRGEQQRRESLLESLLQIVIPTLTPPVATVKVLPP